MMLRKAQPQNTPAKRPSILGAVFAGLGAGAFLILVKILAAVRWMLGEIFGLGADLLYAALIHICAEPYTDAEIYDPFFDSDDYELAREIAAIEVLLTGRIADSLGVCRLIRLLGGAEPVLGLGILMAAERETADGDLVFLTFEYDGTRLEAAVFRTPGQSPRRSTDRVCAADSTLALMEFYSDRAPRQEWA